MASSAETVVDDSWRVQLFIAARDGNLEFIESVASSYPNAIHENFCECLDDGVLEWESLKWYEFGEATCLYIATSYCQLDVARWLLENGVDREKACYHGQTPLDVVGQCRFDAEAALDIRQALTEELKRPRAPVAPSCIAKIGYDDIVKKVYETVQVGKARGTGRLVEE